MKMLLDNVLVKMDEPEKVSAGGIVMPDVHQKRNQKTTGTVRAAGPGRVNNTGTFVPCGVAAGDRVLLSKYSGTDIKVNGEDLRIVPSSEIQGVLEDGDEA